jgi:hypothetical protein
MSGLGTKGNKQAIAQLRQMPTVFLPKHCIGFLRLTIRNRGADAAETVKDDPKVWSGGGSHEGFFVLVCGLASMYPAFSCSDSSVSPRNERS